MAISSVQASISVVCQLLLWLPFIQCTNSKAPTTNTRSIETLAATSDIHLAALKNDVQGKDVNARLRSTDTPLLLATSRGNVASGKFLCALKLERRNGLKEGKAIHEEEEGRGKGRGRGRGGRGKK
eukprot:761540-Hanusia_phi.AAC.1